MKKISWPRQWLAPMVWFGSYLVVAMSLLWWRLAVVPAAASPAELASCTQSQTWSTLGQHIVGAPYQLLQHFVANGCSPQHLFWLRLPSTLIAGLAGWLFVIAVRQWLGRRAAWYGGALFLTSSWFLHIGRLAAPSVMLLLVIPALLALYQRARTQPTSRLTGLWAILTVTLALYVPGGIWLVIFLLSLSVRQLRHYFQIIPIKLAGLYSLLVVALVAPLGWALVAYPTQLAYWLGWPAKWQLIDNLKDIVAVPLQLFVRGPQAPAVWLGHIPVLDIFTSVMVIIGTVLIIHHSSWQRRVFLVGLGLIAIVLSGLRADGAASLSLVVPLAYFGAAGGIQALLRRWFAIFPRNPFARSLAYSLIAIVVAGAIILNTRAYYIAWPHTPATLEVFSQKS